MQPLTIIKIGGKLLNDPAKFESVLLSFSKIKGPKILVHGGGAKSSELSKQLGIIPLMVEGRRITDDRTLEVVVMVYAGLFNKTMVGKLQSFGCNAIGLSGVDGNALLANKRKGSTVDFGFVGDIDKVDTNFIENLIKDGLTPVFCAITHDGKGQLLNTNADTIAAELATSLVNRFDVTLKFIFEKKGVLSNPYDESSALPVLTKQEYDGYKNQGNIGNGMIPKLDNAFRAKNANVNKVFVCSPTGIDEHAAFKGTEICV